MGQQISNTIHNGFNHIQNAVNHVTQAIANRFRQIAPPIVQYVVQHPIRTISHVASIVVLFSPGVIAAPLMGVFGFTEVGIAAGSLAASLQSAMGVVPAGGVFATIQSAAMGGYGAATVAHLTSAAVAAANAVGYGRR